MSAKKYFFTSLLIIIIASICGMATERDNDTPFSRRYGTQATKTIGGAPSTQGLRLSTPYWDSVLDAGGYSDYIGWWSSPKPHIQGEMLSGEWGAAIYYDSISTAPNAMWLTDMFIYPNWSTNSNFQIFKDPNAWDDPRNPVIGNDTGYSVIRNGQVEIRIDYEVVDLGEQDANTGEGGSPLAFRDANGVSVFVYSERYVLLQTYTITNISQNDINNLEFYQMLCGFWMNHSVYETTGYFDPLPVYMPYNLIHKGGNFNYDITQWDSGYNNWIGFSSTVAPDLFENGFYRLGSPGTHQHVQGRNLNNEPNSNGDAGAMGWYLGALEPNESVAITLAVMLGAGPISEGSFVTLEKVADINDDNCVELGDEITYTISYAYPNGSNEPNLLDFNDVNIIDYLPDEVDFNSASGPNCVRPDSNTVIWHIGTLHPGDSGSVTMTVKVKSNTPLCGTVRNRCEIRSYGDVLRTAYENTSICCNCEVVENFDTYADYYALMEVWKDGLVNGTGAYIDLATNPSRGGKSMQYWFWDYSEAYADIVDLPGMPGSDWSGYQTLTLYFYCQTGNYSGEPMFIALSDGENPPHTAKVMYDGDMNDVNQWHQWNIELQEFVDNNNINLANVAKISIGFGAGGYGTVYFDDIRLCRGVSLAKNALFEGDCVGPGDEITYTIDYENLSGPVDDVNLVDYLPDEVEFVLSDSNGSYDPIFHTVTWNLGTLEPNELGTVSLTVMVKCPQPGGTITNYCEIRGGGVVLSRTYEYTPVCCCPTIRKIDIAGCVNPGEDTNYSICYAAHGYGDTNVVITDFLPDEVNYVSSDPCGTYDPENHKITWGINFTPDAGGCVNLVVQIKNSVSVGSLIRNNCNMKGDCIDINDYEDTSVCQWCPVYVDASATGGNNGYSWQYAFTNLQDALSFAKDHNCNDIRVAQGIYWPDVNSNNPSGSGDREATFQLINGVAIYGGFPAGGGQWEERNPAIYETILSGDLLGNDIEVAEPCDLSTDPCRADNSYHVVTGIGVNNTTILDGFTITAGNANGAGWPEMNDIGGGMYNENGSPTVKNCEFIKNSAIGYIGCGGTGPGGGGMYSKDSNSTITNCLFNNNWANSCGGGMYCDNDWDNEAEPNITNCTFVGNGACFGGGIHIGAFSRAKVTNCILWENEGGQVQIDGEAIVTYSDIQGWPSDGNNNINEDPVFEADGYHLSLCSPCIDAGTNTPPGGLPGEDIDGEDRIMDGNCDGEPVVDMGADEYYLEDCNILLAAHCPKPACGVMVSLYVGQPPEVNLTWHPGIYAAEHDVYFGTDCSEVNNATTATPIIYKGRQSEPIYLASDLNVCTTYCWRIDEVNDPCIWVGSVCSFRTGLFIDDFERYDTTEELKDVWLESMPICWGYAGTGRVSLIHEANNKYMRFTYDKTPNGIDQWFYFSEVRLDYGPNGADWTGGGLVGNDPLLLVIPFKGATGNSIDPDYDRMYVAIEDTDGDVNITLNPDPNAQATPCWQEWEIPLADLNNPDVNLDAVRYFSIGFGVRCMYDFYGGGDGNVMFDDIRLQRLNADFNGDCFVNFYDFAVFSQEWLTGGVCVKADIYPDSPDGIVDFRDFAVLAEEWLTEDF